MDEHAPEPIRMFLLDDHEIVRNGVRDLLDTEPGITVIGEAAAPPPPPWPASPACNAAPKPPPTRRM